MLVIILVLTHSYEVLAATNIVNNIDNILENKLSKINLGAFINYDLLVNKGDKSNNVVNENINKKILEYDDKSEKIHKANNKEINLIAPVITMVKTVNRNTNIITWNGFDDSIYEIEVDGKIINVSSNRAYIHRNMDLNIEHTYRVRAKNSFGISPWGELVKKKVDYALGEKENEALKSSTKKVDDNISSKNSPETLSEINEYNEAYLTTSVHIIGRGWLETEYDEVLGDVEDVVDQVKIRLNNVPTGRRIKYRSYVKNTGWQSWTYDGNITGIIGKEIQAIEVKVVELNSDNVEVQAEGYSIQYVLYCADFSNVDTISKDGETSGIIGKTASAFWAQLINSREFIKEVIKENTKWTTSGSPYVIKGDLIINQGVKLEIDPGVKVVFEKYSSRTNGIEINGNLAINGTVNSPVNFTYSENGNAISPDNFTYKGLYVTQTGSLTANYLNMEYKGEAITSLTNRGQAIIKNSIINSVVTSTPQYNTGILLRSELSTSIENTTINNYLTGVNVQQNNGTFTFKSNKVNNSNVGMVLSNHLMSNTGQININNNELTNNDEGIVISEKNSKVLAINISNNNIKQSKYSGIKIYADDLSNIKINSNIISGTDSNRKYTGGGPLYLEINGLNTDAGSSINNINPKDESMKNTFSGNKFDGLMMSGSLSSNIKLPKGTSNYIIDGYLTIPKDKQMEIEAGTNINIRGYIMVDGKVIAEGSSTLPITFTSISDSINGVTHTTASGYDINRDNNYEAIYISETGDFRGVNVKARKGGRDYEEGASYFPSNFKSWGNLNLINSEVGDSLSNGIFSIGNLSVINSKVYNCLEDGISSRGTLNLINSTLSANSTGLLSYSDKESTIVSNTFSGNKAYGLYNLSAKNVDAKYNYWGSPYGPSYYDNIARLIKNGELVSHNIIKVTY